MSLLCRFLMVTAIAILTIGPTAAQAATVVRAARWLDVTSGQLRSPANILIEGSVIKSVDTQDVPSGADVIDLGDVTLLPGLIDVHTHLTLDFEGDWVQRPVTELPADAALRGARNARRTLEAGFTTVRDVGAPGFADVSLARAIDAGLIAGPRVIPSGHAISITGGHCDDTGWAPGILEHGPEAGIVDGIDGALKAVRYQAKHGAKVIKICATAGVLWHHCRCSTAVLRRNGCDRPGRNAAWTEGRRARPRNCRHSGSGCCGGCLHRARVDAQ